MIPLHIEGMHWIPEVTVEASGIKNGSPSTSEFFKKQIF